ncbi:MAG: GSCFA domain-containing protein [Candidatus Aminicenantes bacterium]|jgi:hypothetical protein
MKYNKKGVAPPTHSRSAGYRSFGGFISKVSRKNKVLQGISKKGVAGVFKRGFGVRRKYREAKNYWSRKHPPPHQGVPAHGLEEYQVHPYGDNFFPGLVTAVKREFNGLTIDLDTPIASIGSCFAEEFAYYMMGKKFNYIQAEKSRLGASANWGRVYTIPNLKQIVDYSLDKSYPILVEKTAGRSLKKKEQGWFDPLRDKSPIYPEPDTAAAEIQSHRKASLKVFKEARVLVVTLGQNEGWHDQKNDLIWAQRPPTDILEAEPKRFLFETFKQPVVLDLMKDCLSKLFRLNPELRVILTVSPVPAFATFHKKPVITDSFANKCLLRVIAEDITEEFKGKVFYFPSFEIVLAYNPFSYRADNRHVMPRSLKKIFNVIEKSLRIKN